MPNRRRPPSGAKNFNTDKAKQMEASKSGKGTLTSKEKSILRNANVREAIPTKNKYSKKASPVQQLTQKIKQNSSPVKGKPKSLPKTRNGSEIVKKNTKKAPKNMGKANVVGKKALSDVSKAAKSTPFSTAAVGMLTGYMDRTSSLIKTGNIKSPMSAFGDKALYGDRLNKKTTEKTSAPAKGKAKVVSRKQPKGSSGAVSGTVVSKQQANMLSKQWSGESKTRKEMNKPIKRKAPAEKSPVNSPKRTATSGWKSQTAPATKKRLAKGNTKVSPPKGTPVKKKKLPASASFIQNASWDD